MSEPINNEHIERASPANLDLYQEQARQSTMLGSLCEDVKEIKECLIGKDGLIVEVDRLKRGRKVIIAIGWLVFTTIVGTVATVVAQYIGN